MLSRALGNALSSITCCVTYCWQQLAANQPISESDASSMVNHQGALLEPLTLKQVDVLGNFA
ncbi:hypothetical protein PF005_g28447 [Phytophthora fragariae]|uniref:Uncharacterized protein n=1 Tax=Phytophthora fragariae TaxID=53985 RepID=A0A6A3VMH1_9STRA|nr:hypothetical protein PF003_g15732 [Phytophthora fragariae]KAE8920751.1 hypothetical protein PF009_g28960 [Phytophthora fragariae]KAE9066540.1 hypothetical protein PF007_g28408 [Phytophthora fragariae]KAE9076842.1 hypothetical protein PF006_g28043 [Phytophthora fragariae]KAE9168289.1 hypothetical protein PF005_g28447 [Phytophthora fragariae]